ncbi:MAG TPA: hypothetical protein P5533_02005 [Candidatus Cloacimonadota bacterium]|nr:hypothetical protein [Candidatus Cloacimonadota bacterium]
MADWKRNLFFQVRWWHLLWLGLIISVTIFGVWSLTHSRAQIRLIRVDDLSGAHVARIGLSSRLPFRYTIEPFHAEVWRDDVLCLRFQPFDGIRQISPGEETELLLVFNLEDVSAAPQANNQQNYKLKAIIPLTVLGITRAESFQASFSSADTEVKLIP